MINILLASPRSQESHILKSAFRQKGFMAKIVPAEGATYLNIQKSIPHVIFVEMLKEDINQIKFIENVSSNKLLKNIPVICYGTPLDKESLSRYIQAGAKTYLARPLKLGVILETIANQLARCKSSERLPADQNNDLDKAEYFDILLNPKRLVTQKLEIMTKQVDRAKAFPFTISKIISLTENTQTSVNELSKAIESDPTMSANTLKISNSVFFRSKYRVNGKIKTIPEAIMRIGFSQTQKIAASLIVAELINQEENSFGFNREDFWFHSIATAIITEEIAKKCDIKEHSLAYLAGLLHDYGIVLYDDFLQEIFVLMLENTYTNHTTFEESGLELIGLTHSEFTAELFESWNLPKELSQRILHHKNFVELVNSSSMDKDTVVLSQIVGLANILAKSSNIGRSCDEFIHPVTDKLMKKLWLQKGIDPSFFSTVHQQVALYGDFLNLPERNIPGRSYVSGPEENPFSLIILNEDEKIFEPHLLYLENIGFNILTYKNFGEFSDVVNANKVDIVAINTSFKTEYNKYRKYLEILAKKSTPKIVFCEDKDLECVKPDPLTKTLSKSIELNLVIEAIDSLFRDHKCDYANLIQEQ